MKRRSRWFLTMIGLVVLPSSLLSVAGTYTDVYGQAWPIAYGRVGSEPYPAAGTVTFIAYLKKGGETDNQILTEDNMSSGTGTDQGYNGIFFKVDNNNFSSPAVADGDTLEILFTGIGGELGNAGSIKDAVSADSISWQYFGHSSWGTSTNPAVPTGLQASNVSPGVVDLSWIALKNAVTYRLYRSSQGSGHPTNGASNGRYTRIAKDIAGTTHQDDSAPTDTCWYMLVAEDGGKFSGHCDEVSIDAALPVQLTTFTATGGENKVILEWTTESEWNNRGFHIYRRGDTGRNFQRITQELIAGAGNTSEPQTYSWEDRRVENGQTYWYQLESVDFQGGTQTYGPVSATPTEALPQTYRLYQNYPNPFNPETWISYQLPKFGPVTIKIYNVKGQLVTTLVDGEQAPGTYRVRWSGRDLHGAPAASGVYFCQMKGGQYTRTTKMVLLR